MKALILQHEKSTPPGSTIEWLETRKIPFEIVDVSTVDALPSVDQFDVLIICGGSMNVDEETKHHWLQSEKELIRQSIEKRKPTVGLCLGGQLIAEVLGATVQKQPQYEVGWHEIQISNDEKIMAFQWHGYGFEIPSGAHLTATNSNHKNQAFSYGTNVLAFQFHPETTKEWALECSKSPRLPKTGFVQTAEEIRRDTEFQPVLQKWYFSQLDFLLEKNKLNEAFVPDGSKKSTSRSNQNKSPIKAKR